MRDALRMGIQIATTLVLCGLLINSVMQLMTERDRQTRLVAQALFSDGLASSSTVTPGARAGGLLDYWELRTVRGALSGYAFDEHCSTAVGLIRCIVAVDTGGYITALVPVNQSEWFGPYHGLCQNVPGPVTRSGHIRNQVRFCFFEQFKGVSVYNAPVAEAVAGNGVFPSAPAATSVARAVGTMLVDRVATALTIIQGRP